MSDAHYGGTVTLFPNTTKDPITLIGQMAGVCWGADVNDGIKNYKRGIDCILNNHGRTLEFPDVYMVLDDWSARVIREYYTHIGGAPTRLQESTRYIRYADFDYVIPPLVAAKGPEAEKIYRDTMTVIADACSTLEAMGVPREDAGMLLPLGMDTRIVTKINLRTLMDMSRQRMCSRAYHEFRLLFNTILKALRAYSKEWATICSLVMMPKCEALGYCPEKYSCGRKPQLEGTGKPKFRYTYVWNGRLPDTLPAWVTAGDINTNGIGDNARYLVKADHILTDEEKNGCNVSEAPVSVEYVKE